MAQTIRIRRRTSGAAGAPATLALGEPAYNDNGDTLDIGNGTAVRRLVGADRQLELTGTQTVGAGAGNAKVFDLTNFRLLGGASGNVVTRGAADGDVLWGAAPSTAVITGDSLTGDGTAGDPLDVVFATDAEIATGTDTDKAINSAGLRSQLGAAASTLTTTATTVVPAINELVTRVAAMSGAIQLVGTYDADTDDITPGLNSPATAGALPAASAANQGWYLIVDVAGTGTGNAPAVSLALGDWLLSTGTEWLHFAMNLGVIAASNVSVTSIGTGSTATNVQDALEELHTGLGNALTTIHVDGDSITGDGLTAGTALEVGTVDGGTF